MPMLAVQQVGVITCILFSALLEGFLEHFLLRITTVIGRAFIETLAI